MSVGYDHIVITEERQKMEIKYCFTRISSKRR